MKTLTYNILMTPLVLLVRAPIMIILIILIKIGELSEKIVDNISHHLPSYRRFTKKIDFWFTLNKTK